MKKKSILIVALAVIMMFVLTACGNNISDDKWDTIQSKYSEIMDKHDEAKKLCEDMGMDSSSEMGAALEQAESALKDVGDLDRGDFKDDEEADQVIEQLDGMLADYDSILSSLNTAAGK